MRVAYLINQYPKVSHTFIRREIHALERQGIEVVRFALRGWNSLLVDADDKAEQTKTRYVLGAGLASMTAALLRAALLRPMRFASAMRQAIRLGKGGDRPLPVYLVYLAEACVLLHWLQAERVTHLHAHFGTNAVCVAMLVRMLGGPPYSFTVHGPEEFDKAPLLQLSMKASKAAFVAAISSFGRSQLYRWLAPPDWAKVKVVHCGLDSDYFAMRRESSQAAARLVCVGRLCEQKGQMLLIEAAAMLHARGVAFELVLAGDGEMRPQLEQAIADRGLQARVRITGHISGDQVQQELLGSRGLVLPSLAEGLPVVIMEAMALRRPVISTYVAGIPELVAHGETGWLVPAGAVRELAEAMQDCLSASPERLARMGLRGRERALQRHHIDVAASRLAHLFAGQPA